MERLEKVKKYNYKFTNKKHAEGGVKGMFFAVASWVVLIVALVISYQNRGEGDVQVATSGFASFILAITGLFLAIKSYKEEDKYYLFSILATIFNSLVLLLICSLIVLAYI